MGCSPQRATIAREWTDRPCRRARLDGGMGGRSTAELLRRYL